MNFYWVKTNRIIKKLFKQYIWDIPNFQNRIYLTFDDGPTPQITEWVLEELANFNAKATFFCIGNNIIKYPEIFEKVIYQGHSIGNHTFDHLNGWNTTTEAYIENSVKWLSSNSIFVNRNENKVANLFRPPYGKIKPSQSKRLQQLGFKIIMWDVLSADFDCTISQEKCLRNVTENVKSGSIIVFHDSVKAFPHLKYTLPKVLEFLNKKGFVFATIQ